MRFVPTAVVAVLQTAAVVLGNRFGVAVHWPGRPPNVYTPLALAAATLLLLGLFGSVIRAALDLRPRAPWACAAAVSLMAWAVVAEPFLPGPAGNKVTLAVATVGAAVATSLQLARHGHYLSAAGLVLFDFIGVAMLSSNLNVRDGGAGFLGWWTT
jgi:hypothetical protein